MKGATLIPFAICFLGGIATALFGLPGLVAAVAVAVIAPVIFVVRRRA